MLGWACKTKNTTSNRPPCCVRVLCCQVNSKPLFCPPPPHRSSSSALLSKAFRSLAKKVLLWNECLLIEVLSLLLLLSVQSIFSSTLSFSASAAACTAAETAWGTFCLRRLDDRRSNRSSSSGFCNLSLIFWLFCNEEEEEESADGDDDVPLLLLMQLAENDFAN